MRRSWRVVPARLEQQSGRKITACQRDHDSIRPIVRYPDPRLALPAQPVTVFDGALRDLAQDLPETMHAAPGIGITAPHIGVSLRVVVLDLDGNAQSEESAGLRGVCHQHEIDQLNGLFWIQRLSRLKRERLIKRFEKVSRSP